MRFKSELRTDGRFRLIRVRPSQPADIASMAFKSVAATGITIHQDVLSMLHQSEPGPKAVCRHGVIVDGVAGSSCGMMIHMWRHFGALLSPKMLAPNS